MQAERLRILETLTGVRSSKKNYYVELQKNIDEVTLRNKQLEIINRIAKSFNVDMPIERIISCLVEKLATVLLIDEFSLSKFVDGECRSVTGQLGPECKKTRPCNPTGVCRYIIKNKKSLLLPDEIDLLGLSVTAEICPGSAVFIPLIVRNSVIGIFNIKSKKERAYSQQDVAFLLQVAEHLAVGIHNRRLFSEVLKKQKEWEDTFRAITDAIVIIDTDYRIIRSNEIAKKLFNLTDVHGKLICYEIIHRRTVPCEACPLTMGSSETKRAYQFVEGTNNDVYDVYAYPIIGQNGVSSGVVETFKDVTQQVACEWQLMQSEKLAAIGKLAAGVAHELNSPLTAILGNAQLLLREFPTDSENHVLIEDIKQCGVRCKNIILNLLSFARQQPLETELLSVNEVVNKAIRLVKNQICQEQIELVFQPENNLPEITGSGQQLEQVIINLLINAKDALDNKPANKKISITTGRCKRGNADQVFVSVRDNGCGMDTEQLSQIFTPFYTTKESEKGTGLGLAVSLGIIQNHGGTIECESKPGAGSNFVILLPVREPE